MSSLINRIIFGFGLIMCAVLVITFTTYRFGVQTSTHLEYTAKTLPSVLDSANTLSQKLQHLNRIVLVHANQSSAERRQQLSSEFDQVEQEFNQLLADLNDKVTDFSGVHSQVGQIGSLAGTLLSTSRQHLAIHDLRLEKKNAAIAELRKFDDEWIFFEQDIQELMGDAESAGEDRLAWDLNFIIGQGDGASSYIKNILSISEREAFTTVEKELLAYFSRFEEKAKPVMAHDEYYKELVEPYLVTLQKAIVQDNGLLGLQSSYIASNTESGELLSSIGDQLNQLLTLSDQLVESVRVLSHGAVAEAEEEAATSLFRTIALTIISLVIAVTVAFIVVRGIRRPLSAITEHLNNLGLGDLTHRTEVIYSSEMNQIVESINELSGNLSGLIQKIHASSDTISRVADNQRQLGQKTNRDIDAQKEETNSVATAVTEMESAVIEVASHAAATSDDVELLTHLAQSNMDGMSNNVEFVQQLKVSLEEAATVIKDLSTETNMISEILTVIQGISEQTNLLALNAAIEAARAGEQGRGFAVVADEVRSLATRTQASANEIGEMIERLQGMANQTVGLVETNLTHADKSVEVTSQSSESLGEMVEKLGSINDMSKSIATACEEQSVVAKEVAQNIVGISDLAMSIADDSRQSIQESESLHNLSVEQTTLVSTFKL